MYGILYICIILEGWTRHVNIYYMLALFRCWKYKDKYEVFFVFKELTVVGLCSLHSE